MKNIIVGYHANCPDGFTAAWCAWKKFGDSAEYVPLSYNGPRPDWNKKEVYILDFCYSQDEMNYIKSVASSVVILDHHKTSEKIINSFEGCIFDNSRSGCGIAWDYFIVGKSRPFLIKHVEDRDLWSWKVEGTEEYCVALDCEIKSFDNYDRLANMSDEQYTQYIKDGAVMSKQLRSLAEEFCSSSKLVMFGGEKAFIANGPIRINSLMGNILAEKSGTFGIVWRCDDGKNVSVSLRGVKDYDVSRIALQFGGGGHKSACGINMPMDKFLENVVYLE